MCPWISHCSPFSFTTPPSLPFLLNPRYMEASKPLGHPTPVEMEPPQLEQALALAEMASERCKLSFSPCTPLSSESGDENGKSPVGGTASTGLLPLALAWEGSALALLAARGEWTKPFPCGYAKSVLQTFNLSLIHI